MKKDLEDLNICLVIWKGPKKQSFCSGLVAAVLSGSDKDSLMGHLNNYFVGGREEWSTATSVIGKKPGFFPISQIRVIFVVFCLFVF